MTHRISVSLCDYVAINGSSKFHVDEAKGCESNGFIGGRRQHRAVSERSNGRIRKLTATRVPAGGLGEQGWGFDQCEIRHVVSVHIQSEKNEVKKKEENLKE